MTLTLDFTFSPWGKNQVELMPPLPPSFFHMDSDTGFNELEMDDGAGTLVLYLQVPSHLACKAPKISIDLHPPPRH